MTGDWHTYVEAAELLGISPNAARHRATRGRWQRTLGNDKRTRIAADFAERDAKHAAELAIERTLADNMSARVDQLTAELAAGRAMAERGLAAELARAWWKPLLRRR